MSTKYQKTDAVVANGKDNLLPCPFCGEKAELFHRDEPSGWSNTDWVCCGNEDCGCGTCLHESKELAVAAWNRRAAEDWTVSASETARAVLDYLGIGSDASLEPGADRRQDNVAKLITAHFDRLKAEQQNDMHEQATRTPKSKKQDRTVYWIGSEEDQQRERLKACRARIAQYGDGGECEHDGMCAECEHDMAMALRVTKEEYDAAEIG